MEGRSMWRLAAKLVLGIALGLFVNALALKEVRADGRDFIPKLVEAETTEEFMEAVDYDTTIVLAPGEYDLTKWLEEADLKPWEEGTDAAGLYVKEEFDGPALYICGYEGLRIVSADPKDPAKLICAAPHANVMNFVFCRDILLDSLVLGHAPDAGSCTGAVLYFESSDVITIADTELYGCGIYGLVTDYCDDIKLLNCDVHDCSEGCVMAEGSSHFTFLYTDFHDCQGYPNFKLNGAMTELIGCSLQNLKGDMTDTGDFIISGGTVENCFDGYGVVNPEVEFGGDENGEPEKPDNEPEKQEEPVKTTEKPAEPVKDEEEGLISYTVKSHPKELKDGDASLATGNYYEILLSGEDKAAYPALSEVIDSLNEAEDQRVTEAMSGNEADIFELRENSGMEFYFEFDSFFTPQRTDSQLFSYAVMDYTYLGGAHGVSAYRCYHIDPKTGKDIPLTDVVKDPEDLPAVVLEELKKDPEYKDYYKDNASAEQTLKDTMEGFLENDGENLRWTLDYEGMYIYFNDYEIGAYAMGAPRVFLAFSDHAELFNASFIYSGEIPEGDSNMTFVSDAPTEILKSKEHSAALLPLYWGSAPFWPEEEEEYGDGYSYSTYTDLYETDPEEYPLLAKALNELNEQNMDTYEQWLPLLKDRIDREYSKSSSEDAPWPSFTEEGIFSLCRADEAVLSFVKYQNFSGIDGEEDPESYAQGINLDPKTGRSVDLYEVITSKDEFLKDFEEELSETDFYVEDWKEVVEKQVNSALMDSVIYSGAESGLSFTVDYNGLTLYFNGDDTGYDDGPCTLHLSFAEYPKLFQEKYLTVPVNYCSELMTGDFEYVYWYEFDGDGEAEPVSLIREKKEMIRSEKQTGSARTESSSYLSAQFAEQIGTDDWDYWYQYSMRWGDSVFELSEVGEFYYASAFLMHDRGNDYLYICATTENDYETVHVYEITTEAINYLGAVDGAIKFNTYPDEEGEPIGYLPVDPRNFKMDTVDYTLGTGFLIGDYEVGYDGLPDQISYYLDYTNTDYWNIKAVKDIRADLAIGLVDPEEWTPDTPAAEYQRGTIKKGDYVQLYRLGLGNELLLKTKDGKVYRLIFSEGEDGYPRYYEGEILDDLFEGQVYAG